MAFNKAARDQAEAILAARKDKPDAIEYEFVDYKGALLALCSVYAVAVVTNRGPSL